MNYVDPISRYFLCQYRNGDDFTTNPTTDYSSYFQGNVLENIKLNATYDVSTITSATTDMNIRATTFSGDIVTMQLPVASWNIEGFVVGNSVRIEVGAASTNGVVTSIVGSFMKIDSAGFFTALSTASGDWRDDYVLKVTTKPTSLIFKFGLRPNSDVSNNYLSLLDGQTQGYSKNGVDGTLSALNYISTNSSNLGTVKAKYDSTSGTGSYIFRFTVEHTFRIPHYIASWLSNYEAATVPDLFFGTESIRYVSELNFGVNIANPNDGKIFIDDFELGSVGFNNQNFNTGSTNYELVSSVLDIGGTVVPQPEATVTNSITAQIQRLDADFDSGVEAIVYHTRLASEATYSSNSNSYESNFMIDQVRQTEGAADVSGDIIKDLSIDINGVDASLLDITFDIIYDAAEQARLSEGETIFIEIAVGDVTLSAELSDRMGVPLLTAQLTKDSDVSGLIDTFEIAFNSLGSTVTSSNINLWNNRAIECEFSFNLNKSTDYESILLNSLRYDLVAYKTTTDEFFSLDTFTFPMGFVPVVMVIDTLYQLLNLDTTRSMSVPEDCTLREVQLNFSVPSSAGAGDPSEITGKFGFIVPWREWVLNEEVPYEFYDGALPPNFNRNYRTSNYSDELGFDIYVFLTAKVNTLEETELGVFGVNTDYILQSHESFVYDFDVDGTGNSWTHVSTKFYNEEGAEIEDIDLSGLNTVEIIMAMPSAGTMSMVGVLAEITNEPTLTTGRHWRLHSTLDLSEPSNPLQPESGETGVKITQMVSENQIKLTCVCDGTKLENVDQNFYGHLFK